MGACEACTGYSLSLHFVAHRAVHLKWVPTTSATARSANMPYALPGLTLAQLCVLPCVHCAVGTAGYAYENFNATCLKASGAEPARPNLDPNTTHTHVIGSADGGQAEQVLVGTAGQLLEALNHSGVGWVGLEGRPRLENDREQLEVGLGDLVVNIALRQGGGMQPLLYYGCQAKDSLRWLALQVTLFSVLPTQRGTKCPSLSSPI